MKYSYDVGVGAAYVTFDGGVYAKLHQVEVAGGGGGVIIDVDSRGSIFGVEILNANCAPSIARVVHDACPLTVEQIEYLHFVQGVIRQPAVTTALSAVA